jgi:hypothetical protein
MERQPTKTAPARRPLRALVRAVAALAVGASLAGPAPATTESVAPDLHPAPAGAATPVLLTAVAAWVATVTDLPMTSEPPAVVFSDPAAMAALRLGNWAAGATPEHAGADEIVALYDTGRRTIHLPAGWIGATPEEMSVLVHEMVHHLQTVAGRRHGCPAEREKLAYAAQDRWLGLFGSDLAATFEIDPLTLLVLTTCGM